MRGDKSNQQPGAAAGAPADDASGSGPPETPIQSMQPPGLDPVTDDSAAAAGAGAAELQEAAVEGGLAPYSGGGAAARQPGSSGGGGTGAASTASDGTAGSGGPNPRAEEATCPLDLALFRTPIFMMNAFKVTNCSKRAPHDWKACPFAHPGEKGRRRPLSRFDYDAVMCSFVRRGQPCPEGDRCNKSHNVFELWCHPQRFRSQMCVDAERCDRKVCFFAHSGEELRPATYPNAGAPSRPSRGSSRGGGGGGWDGASPHFLQPSVSGGGGVTEQQQLGIGGPPGLGIRTASAEGPQLQQLQQLQQQPAVPAGSWGGAAAEQQGQSGMLGGAMGQLYYGLQQMQTESHYYPQQQQQQFVIMPGYGASPFPSAVQPQKQQQPHLMMHLPGASAVVPQQLVAAGEPSALEAANQYGQQQYNLQPYTQQHQHQQQSYLPQQLEQQPYVQQQGGPIFYQVPPPAQQPVLQRVPGAGQPPLQLLLMPSDTILQPHIQPPGPPLPPSCGPPPF